MRQLLSAYWFWVNRFAFRQHRKILRRRFEMETMFAAEYIENGNPSEVLNAVRGAHARHPAACLTCSFQAEDMIVLHLLRERIPSIPVLFLETSYHSAVTYEYRYRIT